MVRFCEACRAIPRCRTCERVGGGHLDWCTWSQPNRRPVPTYQDRVTVEHFVAVYTDVYPLAVRVARRLVGPDAEDIVQVATLYLWSRRLTLRHLDRELFMTAVKHRALMLLASAWHQHVVAMDPETLDVVERMNARPR